MGSLMSGWDAPIYDPQEVKEMRNKSLTREEIEAYWRSKKKTEEEHMKAISPSSPPKGGLITRPPIITKHDFDTYIMDEFINKNNCWWTMSKWAFLNEPPTTGEGSKHKYASQHHVASGFASTNPDTRITSTYIES